jgi:hypothetical protein
MCIFTQDWKSILEVLALDAELHALVLFGLEHDLSPAFMVMLPLHPSNYGFTFRNCDIKFVHEFCLLEVSEVTVYVTCTFNSDFVYRYVV